MDLQVHTTNEYTPIPSGETVSFNVGFKSHNTQVKIENLLTTTLLLVNYRKN